MFLRQTSNLKHWSFESVEQWSPHKNIFKKTKWKSMWFFFIQIFIWKTAIHCTSLVKSIKSNSHTLIFCWENDILWDSTPPTYSGDYQNLQYISHATLKL